MPESVKFYLASSNTRGGESENVEAWCLIRSRSGCHNVYQELMHNIETLLF